MASAMDARLTKKGRPANWRRPSAAHTAAMDVVPDESMLTAPPGRMWMAVLPWNAGGRLAAICWSVKMKEMPSPLRPALRYMICRSALRSLTP